MILNVTKQEINIVDPNVFVSETVNNGELPEYVCTFEFDESWNRFSSKTAVFKKGSIRIPVIISNNSCVIPPEMLETGKNHFQIGVFGTIGGSVYPTAWSKSLYVAEGCYADGEYTPTPAIFAQIMEALSAVEETANGAVRFDIYQELRDDQKAIARHNIGSDGSGGSSWENLSGKPFATLGAGLKVVGNELQVDTTDAVEEDNTKPVTSAAVHVQIGNIEVLLSGI